MKLEEAARMAAGSDAFLEAADNVGFEIDFQDHATFAAVIASDDERIAAQMEALGLKTQ